MMEGPSLPPLPLGLPPRPLRRPADVQGEQLVRAGLVVLVCLLGGLVLRWLMVTSGGTALPLLLILGSMMVGSLRSVLHDRGQQFRGALGQILRRAERPLLHRLFPHQQQYQVYQAALDAREHELGQRILQLSMMLALLERRYNAENAQAEYSRALAQLQQRREQIQDAGRREREAVRALTEQHARRALKQYLQAQPLGPQTIPEAGPGLLAHLHSCGLHTAWDIQPAALAAAQLPAYQAERLRQWRRGLENFFQFDPRQVPQAELDRIHQTWQARAAQELRQLEQEVRRFQQGGWGVQQQALLAQIRGVKAQLAQAQAALVSLEKLHV